MANQFDLFFNQYSKSLEIWQEAFQAWSKAGEEAFTQYLQGVQISYFQPNPDLLTKYHEMWQTAMKNSTYENIYSWYQKVWDDLWKSSGFLTIQNFNEYWQDILNNSGKEFFQRSQEVMEKLSEQWVSKPQKNT